ncbi:ABC transporter permease [Boseongicola aestuarii]|uniref:Glutathione transport system permease protein GsiD n=1 Tax=Boseongicola aestuarii TaxID=1470561 RepID=A0A238IX63_9RHOB|nr:ABC transporter permease [Boseongicola aestuarii]SMX22631.1 Glutathione transport system permease protein GsiD [Boseongicola aestuarii]
MEPLSWTGSLSVLNPIYLALWAAFGIAVIAQIVLSFVSPSAEMQGSALAAKKTPGEMAGTASRYLFLGIIALTLIYLIGGILIPGIENKGIVGAISARFLPVWIALVVTFALSITFKRKLGLYGKLFDSFVGMIGFAIVMFWVFTGVFSAMDLIVTHDPLSQVSGMKNKSPGEPLAGAEAGEYAFYLLGGDNLARDVFSRMVSGSWVVIQIAPLATLFAFMVGITLGLPAAYYGGKLDTFLSFLANLILAFPVILLFYLLVTPEIVATGLPSYMASVLFLFPIIFLVVLFNSRFYTQPSKQKVYVGGILIVGLLLYFSLISQDRTPLNFWPDALDLFDIPGGVLVVFVSVVFVNSPTVFRIVRGIALDIKTRDYVAAGQTRGEGPWYIMLWEILPNARGPLIVDFCLRIGYTTILLGTLGFFGLGLPPESPDWGSTINDGRRLLSIYPHPALAPAIALMSLVLGLNLLADGLREESLKD